MGSEMRLGRRAFGGLLLAFAVTPGASVYAQGGPDNRATPVTISDGGSYVQVAGPAVVGALDRALGALDSFPDGIRPEQAREAGFRRRLLELRLLMDLFAYAYEPEPLSTYREIVDDGYERVGGYQDITVVSTLLQTAFRTDLVVLRQLRMNVALAALRSGTVRESMREFVSSPPGTAFDLTGEDVPRIWRTAGQAPSDEFDAVGNAARMGASALAAIQADGPFIADVLDPIQEARFHDVRKAVRSVLLLMQMFPDTRAAILPIAEPMFQLVSQYGDVNDAIVAYRLAPALGANQGAAADYLRAEFAKAQHRQGVVVAQRTFEGLVTALSQVQNRHRL
jgi:CHAD domain-containing protein